MRRIDLREVLRQTVAEGYGDLVTRRTGQAVRNAIERTLAEQDGESDALIDFGAVRCLDLSCADEIVGRLLREHGQVRYFILLNLDDAQREAVEFVLERHGLTAVAGDRSGVLGVLGTLSDAAHQAFRVLAEAGSAAPDEVARRLHLSLDTARQALEELHQRRLVRSIAGAYSAPALA